MEPPLPVGRTGGVVIAGRYRLVSVIGRGGMGEVYEASDDRLGRVVALKVVHTTDPTSATRLRAEATVLANLDHPNLITVHDAGEHEGRPFIVTELVRGTSLHRRITEGPMPSADARHIGAQIASALECAHRNGIVHRDLTPANVLLTDDGSEVRLIDFGIALSEHALGLTATGLVIGTPAYLSPEQVEGRAATTASDVYSLGLVLLEALTGGRAFPGTPTESAGARLVTDAPIPEDLGVSWQRLLQDMTRRDPTLRPSAEEVARRLRDLPARDGGPPPAAGLAAAGLAGAGLAGADDRTEPIAVVGDATDVFDPSQVPEPAVVDVAPEAPHRRRWPFAVAAAALVAVVLAVGLGVAAMGDSAGNGEPSTSVEPGPEATAVTEPESTEPPATTAPPTTTAPVVEAPTTTSPPQAEPGPRGGDPEPPDGAGPGDAGKGKGKEKPDD